MTKHTIFNAFCYELAMRAAEKWPLLRLQLWFIALIDWCRPDWSEWKTQQTIEQVDEQVVALTETWETDEREVKASALAAEAQELFPDATVTPLPNAIVPSVMIVTEAPESASEGVRALGGELRITYAPNGLK
jgi:hypothetical protein